MKNLRPDSLVVELCLDQGNIPEWLTLFPAPDAEGWVTGRDGRRFYVPDPQAVLNRTTSRGVDLSLDYEHASEIKAPKGEEAPAAGWFTEFRVSPQGAIEGKLTPTERALNSIRSREYRYISPVPMTDRQTREVDRLSSVALTNQPNLYLPALNREQDAPATFSQPKPKTNTMDEEQLKELCRELGIAEDSKPQAILAAAKTAKQEASLNREATPSLEKFVPRADYDGVLERARNAEQMIQDSEKKTLDAEINREIDAAVKAGKITPATREFYAENCRQQGGLERFRDFVKDAPVIGAASDLDGRKPREVGAELNSEEKAVADQMGVDYESFKQTRDAEAAAAAKA